MICASVCVCVCSQGLLRFLTFLVTNKLAADVWPTQLTEAAVNGVWPPAEGTNDNASTNGTGPAGSNGVKLVPGGPTGSKGHGPENGGGSTGVAKGDGKGEKGAVNNIVAAPGGARGLAAGAAAMGSAAGAALAVALGGGAAGGTAAVAGSAAAGAAAVAAGGAMAAGAVAVGGVAAAAAGVFAVRNMVVGKKNTPLPTTTATVVVTTPEVTETETEEVLIEESEATPPPPPPPPQPASDVLTISRRAEALQGEVERLQELNATLQSKLSVGGPSG